jgi:hypothetical protein
MPDLDDDQPRKKRGWARVRELDARDAIDRQTLETELFANLGRPPVAIDRIAVETLAASVIRARRLRAVGKNDAEERKTILQAIRATGIRPPPAAAGAPPTLEAQLSALGYAPPDSDDEPDDDVQDAS